MIRRGVATVVWLPLVCVVAMLAVIGGLSTWLAAKLVPAVHALAKMGDRK
jgi:hypothetical protein